MFVFVRLTAVRYSYACVLPLEWMTRTFMDVRKSEKPYASLNFTQRSLGVHQRKWESYKPYLVEKLKISLRWLLITVRVSQMCLMGLMYMFDINGKKQTSTYVFVLKGQKQIMMDIIRKQMWVLMMGSTNK